MHPAQYERLIHELESQAATDPNGLRKRARRHLTLGYAYVLGVLIALAALIVGVAWVGATARWGSGLITLLLALLVVAGFIVRALWVRFERPPGREVMLERTPRLAKRVEAIRAALDAPAASVVLLTDDFNASVTQIPRLGIFGFPKTYLMLGVPLMCGLTPQQFDAVLAHEFAHLSGSHPKQGLGIYRMSHTWGQLLAQLEATRSWAAKLFERFIAWYYPRLQAYGFVLSRKNEYEADADAARVTSADAMGSALVALDVRARVLGEQFWPGIWNRVEHEPAPPTQSLSQLPGTLRAPVGRETAVDWIGSALVRRALDDDTHPSLSERLRALGFTREDAALTREHADAFAAPIETTAADYYLGDATRDVLGVFEREWQAQVELPWKARHDQVQVTRSRVNELTARASSGAPLSADELWTLASNVADLDGEKAAIPLLQRMIDAKPGHAGAQFMLGRALLANHDPLGVHHMRHAMDALPESVGEGAELLRRFYAARGDERGVQEMRRRLHEFGETMHAAMLERQTVEKDDRLEPHGLPDGDVERLVAAAEPERSLRALWVARKPTPHFPERPLIVVVAEARGWQIGAWKKDEQELANDLFNRIELSDGAHLLVFVRRGRSSWLVKKMQSVPGACVYEG